MKVVATADRSLISYSFSSDVLHPMDRAHLCGEFVSDVLARMHIEPLDEHFRCDARLYRLPDLTLSEVSCNAVRATRTRDMVQESDTLALLMNVQGTATFSQLGRDATLPADCAMLISDADPSLMERTKSRSLSIHVPRAVLAPMLSSPDTTLLSVVPGCVEALRLLAASVGATRDAAEVAAGRGIRAARMRAIKADVMRNLAGGDLTPAALARRHGVSPRYIRKLFEAEHTSLSQFVLSQRLARVRRILLDERHADRTIGAIAFAAGFGDLSTFNRDFRRHFAMTPSDMRRCRR